MTTIVRVKRHRKEDPVETLVLSFKRKKTEGDIVNSDSNLAKHFLNFSGTVEEKDDKIATTTVESFKKESKYSDFKNKEHTPNIKQKQRKEWKERSEDKRFMLMSCLRSGGTVSNSGDEVKDGLQKNVTIIDVSRDDQNETAENTAEGPYVYDLYSVNHDDESDFSDLYLENLLSVHPLNCELNYNEEDNSEEVDPDEDDSNDENNWRNDYPDSDPDENDDDENDDILAKQLKVFHIDDTYEMSSDSGEENYLNYDDKEKYCYYEAEDLAGKRYARYKANAMKHFMEDTGEEEEDSDELNIECEDDTFGGNSD